jgi:hypothetical protein
MLALTIITTSVACTPEQWGGVERGAKEIHYITTPAATQPTTQPVGGAMKSAATAAAHEFVRVAAQSNPAINGIVLLASLLSGAVAGVAGHFAGKRRGVNLVSGAVSEIATEAANWHNPAQPWTSTTEKLLLSLGHTAVALLPPAQPDE